MSPSPQRKIAHFALMACNFSSIKVIIAHKKLFDRFPALRVIETTFALIRGNLSLVLM